MQRDRPFYLAVDSETTGLDFWRGARPFFISTCDEEGNTRCWCTRVDPYTREVRWDDSTLDEIREYLNGFDTLVFHNSKFDLKSLLSIGLDYRDKQYEDTLIASHAVSSSDKHGLKELAAKYLGIPDEDKTTLLKHVLLACNKARKLGWKLGHDHKVSKEHPEGKRQTSWDYWVPHQLDPNDLSCHEYATTDAERTILLWSIYKDLLPEIGMEELYRKEMKLARIVLKVEEKGISIDFDKLLPTKQYLEEESAKCEIRARFIVEKDLGITDLNIDSGKQLIDLLYNKWDLPVLKKTKNKNPSVDKETLTRLYEELDEDSPQAKFLYQIFFHRAYKAGIGYLEGYNLIAERLGRRWGRLYPSLNQTGTRTTRFSSSNPNGQNIGKRDLLEIAGEQFQIPKLRDVFSPPPGRLWYAIDYSQLELRIFAYLSREQSLIERLESGEDIFRYIASRLFGKTEESVEKSERQRVKNATYATIYGATEGKIDRTVQLTGAYRLYKEQFPGVGRFLDETISNVERDGFIHTLDGYRLDAPKGAAYKGLNYTIQGTAGRIAKVAMMKIADLPWFDWDITRMVFQIHDEIIIETDIGGSHNKPSYIRQVMDCMESAGREMGVNTPVTCSRITTDWGHGEEVIVTTDEIYKKEDR